MGDYSRIKFHATLRADTPAGVLHLLRETFRLRDTWIAVDPVPDHSFFRAPRWEAVFFCTSAYFETPEGAEFLEGGEHPVLRLHSSLKNYDDEIEKFCDWIGPYLADPPGTVVGEKQFLGPTTLLIINDDGRIIELLPPREDSYEPGPSSAPVNQRHRGNDPLSGGAASTPRSFRWIMARMMRAWRSWRSSTAART